LRRGRREGAALDAHGGHPRPPPPLTRTARAHKIKALERNILGFVGIAPIDETLIGLVEAMNDKTRASWFEKLRTLGRRGT